MFIAVSGVGVPCDFLKVASATAELKREGVGRHNQCNDRRPVVKNTNLQDAAALHPRWRIGWRASVGASPLVEELFFVDCPRY